MIVFIAILWILPPRRIVEQARALNASAPPHSDSR
jgi:hypothetical protein